jgi:hypothetical protein
MKTVKIIVLPLLVAGTLALASAFTKDSSPCQGTDPSTALINKQDQTINLYVSHGHCSTPYGGDVDNLLISAPKRTDLGNRLENMQVSFEIRPTTFKQCAANELTENHKSAAIFLGENDEKITFKSTSVQTIGIDWHEINGKMLIKGVEKEVKLKASGVRESNDLMPSALVIESCVNLLDWGIDYDKIVKGKLSDRSTQWMHFNMTIKMS